MSDQQILSKVVEREIELLGTEEEPDRVLEAMERLQEIGEPAVAPLISALKDPQRSSILRQRAIGMFPEYIEDSRAIQPIMDLLRDEDVEVRWTAAEALGDMGERSALSELEYVAKHDEGVFFPMPTFRLSVREAAAEAIEKIRSSTEPRHGKL